MRDEHIIFVIGLPFCLLVFTVATAVFAFQRADGRVAPLIRRAARQWPRAPRQWYLDDRATAGPVGSVVVYAVALFWACASQAVPILAITYPIAQTPEVRLASAAELAAAAAWIAYLVVAGRRSN